MPADHGVPRKISLLVPDLPDRAALGPYLARIDTAHWYSNFGPLVRELEVGMAALFSAGAAVPQHVVSVSNATLGLELAILALDLPAGSRVLVPALTFVASAAAVLRAGSIPVFCDVEPDTWLLSPRIAEAALESQPFDVVMPVSTYGCPQDAAAWDAFQSRTGIPVVIDAAGAFGNQVATRHCALVYSLHATKSLAAAEGGLVVSADPAYTARVRVLANFGIDTATVSPATAGSTGLIAQAGTNGKLSEYHAALALAAMARWDDTSKQRIRMHRRYLELVRSGCPALTLQARDTGGVYSIFPVMLPAGATGAHAWRELSLRGIESRRWYCPPLTEHPAFASLPVAGELGVVQELGLRLIALPFHLLLSDRDLVAVVDTLAEVLAGTTSGSQ